ncbi:MAG: MerR family DNA-binding protein [Acidobacteria bacterium]|jgi:DNA-binding transcriptional MerR regulator|nr:MerR family DNA-binding protein [Acidobacteriota bacterium]
MKMAKGQISFEKTVAPRQSLKIGEVSQLSGIGIEALRFYERSGLLGKPSRSPSGYRLYDDGVLERLIFIKKSQTLGFSLNEIGRIISDAQSGLSPCDEVREIVRRRLAELDERMREMRRYRRELAQTLEEWDKVGRAPGHICGLIEATEMENQPPAAPRVAPKSRHKKVG